MADYRNNIHFSTPFLIKGSINKFNKTDSDVKRISSACIHMKNRVFKPMGQPLIQFKDVFKKFGDNRVLRGVSLCTYQGQVTTIIGKSGEGKSVLLKHMIGLMHPDAGEIFLDGRPLSKMKPCEMDKLREKFSYVFQDTALFDSMTVYDNIALPLQEGTVLPKSEIRRRVENQLQLFELVDFQEKYPAQISGGMKRRVALARALVTDPEVVLLDEPTTGLDPIRRNAVYALIVGFQKKFGFSAVMISHEIPDVFYFSQRIVMLDEGKIRFEGTPEEIRRCDDPLVQQFVQGLEKPADAPIGMAPQLQEERKFEEEPARLQSNSIAPACAKASNVNMHKGAMVACFFVPRQTASQAFIKFFAIQFINYLVDDGSVLEIYFSIPI